MPRWPDSVRIFDLASHDDKEDSSWEKYCSWKSESHQEYDQDNDCISIRSDNTTIVASNVSVKMADQFRATAQALLEPFSKSEDRVFIIDNLKHWKNIENRLLSLQQDLQDEMDPRFMNDRHFISYRDILHQIQLDDRPLFVETLWSIHIQMEVQTFCAEDIPSDEELSSTAGSAEEDGYRRAMYHILRSFGSDASNSDGATALPPSPKPFTRAPAAGIGGMPCNSAARDLGSLMAAGGKDDLAGARYEEPDIFLEQVEFDAFYDAVEDDFGDKEDFDGNIFAEAVALVVNAGGDDNRASDRDFEGSSSSETVSSSDLELENLALDNPHLVVPPRGQAKDCGIFSWFRHCGRK
jgi:hypothetical protein